MFSRVLDVPNYDRHQLRLIKPDMSHAAPSLQWLQIEAVVSMMGADFTGVSLETEQQRIKDILQGQDNYNWMIECDGQVIGSVELNRIGELTKSEGTKTANFSILIGDQSYWGLGIASHVLATVIDWAFGEGGFSRLIARALTINTRSFRALEYLGFSYRGTSTDQDNGNHYTWRNYALDKSAWDNRSVAH